LVVASKKAPLDFPVQIPAAMTDREISSSSAGDARHLDERASGEKQKRALMEGQDARERRADQYS